jgi:scyllo-inositol 2-dehydrogenase (NADP+)
MADVGVGVIGYGLGGRVFHAPFVSAVPGMRLVTILERSGDEAAKVYPEVKISRSMDEVLEDASIAVVVVSTPNETHFALAKQALEAGKHVVIDKPFAATGEEARELADLAAAKGVLAVPFHNRRWDGDFRTVKKLLAEGAVDRLVTFESHFDRAKAPGKRRRIRQTGCSSTLGRTWWIRRWRCSACRRRSRPACGPIAAAPRSKTPSTLR